LKEIAKICNFTYLIYQVEDNKYGVQNDQGEWNGLVGELIKGKADVALASLTINLSRSKVIDLSKPFLNLGLSILFKRPEPKAPKMFSFMKPLSPDIWVTMIFAFVGNI
jgi:ionotropic glutamate receptor